MAGAVGAVGTAGPSEAAGAVRAVGAVGPRGSDTAPWPDDGVPTEVEEFCGWLAVDRGRSPATVAAYRRDLRAYVAHLRARGIAVSDADTAAIDRYLTERSRAGASSASLARAVAAIRGFHRFVVDELGGSDDPAAEVIGPRVPPRLPRALGEEQVATLLDAIVGDGPVDRRDRAVLEVLYGTGMRVSELVGLNLQDLGSDTGLVRVLGKGGRQRLVPLAGVAHDAVATWLSPGGRDALVPRRWARASDGQAVFLNRRGGRLSRQGVWTIMRQRADRAGLSAPGVALHPHVLRHSCATHMLAHGADLRVVQELLGHASVATTQLYTKVTVEQLRRVYEAAHPRAS